MNMSKNILYSLGLALLTSMPATAQQVNDNNTPLHLMRPANQQRYGIPTTKQGRQRKRERLWYNLFFGKRK